jgi:hypothetical protein
MANTPKALFRGAATTTLTTTLYTTPASTTAVVTNIVVANTGASSYTFDLALAGTKIAAGTTIAANSVAVFDIRQVLTATQTIQGGASNTAVNFHISGMEIA